MFFMAFDGYMLACSSLESNGFRIPSLKFRLARLGQICSRNHMGIFFFVSETNSGGRFMGKFLF